MQLFQERFDRILDEIVDSNEYHQLKTEISIGVSMVERNLNEISYKKNGIGSEFKERFVYLANKLSDEELCVLMDFYIDSIRNVSVHYQNYNRNRFIVPHNLPIDNLFEEYHFLELDYPYVVDGFITLYGVYALISLFLTDNQYERLIYLIDKSNIIDTGRELNDYLTVKKVLIDKHAVLMKSNRFDKGNEFIVFEETFIVPIVADFFLELEERLYKNIDRQYYSFKTLSQRIYSKDEGTKDELLDIRNLWAHGNCFYYKQDNIKLTLLYRFIQLLIRMMSVNIFKKTVFAFLSKVRYQVLSFKFKRPAILAKKLTLEKNNKETLICRLKKIKNFRGKDDILPIDFESLFDDLFMKSVVFKYGFDDKDLGPIYFDGLVIIYYKLEVEGSHFIINGFDTGLTEFKEYALKGSSDTLNVRTSTDTKFVLNKIVETPFQIQYEKIYR